MNRSRRSDCSEPLGLRKFKWIFAPAENLVEVLRKCRYMWDENIKKTTARTAGQHYTDRKSSVTDVASSPRIHIVIVVANRRRSDELSPVLCLFSGIKTCIQISAPIFVYTVRGSVVFLPKSRTY